MATIHPYKGYLNTEFHIYAKGTEDVTYEVFPTNGETTAPITNGVVTPNIPCSLKINESGTFRIEFCDGTSTEIIVEDGYKFGGSNYKNSFIFDESDWCFVVMNDRTYFYNRVTEDSYVEAISPDDIEFLSPDYVIIGNNGHDERTIYSLKDQKPILNVSDIVFFNSDLIMWKENTADEKIRLNLYLLGERCIKESFIVSEFIIDSEDCSLIYYHDNSLYKISLSLPLIEKLELHLYGEFTTLVPPYLAISTERLYNSTQIILLDTRQDRVISRINMENPIASINNRKLIDVNERIEIIKSFDISKIGCDEASINVSYLSLNFYPTNWDVFYITKQHTFERKIRKNTNSYSYKIKSVSSNDEYVFENDIRNDYVVIRNGIISFSNYNESLIFGERFAPCYTKGCKIKKHNSNIIRVQEKEASILDDVEGWKPLDPGMLSFQYFEDFGIISNDEQKNYFDLYGNTFNGTPYKNYDPKNLLIGTKVIHTSGKILPNFKTSVSESGRKGICHDSKGIYLLDIDSETINRKKILSDLYDSSSYKSVLLSEDGTQIMYRDNKQTVILDLQTNKADSYDNVYYIKDVNGIRPLFTKGPGALQPRLVNPVTGQIVPCDRMPEYQFVSPNGLLYADTKIDDYVETWDLIANRILSDSEIAEYADNLFYIVGSEKETSKINEENRRQFIENNLQFFKLATQNWAKRGDKQLILSLLRLPYADFAKLFLERRGVAYIKKKSNDSVVAKIQLGDPLWFLNYVSFSYDNRFVAIAGRYPNNSSYGGLFLVYDLINKKEIIAKRNSWAVWMTAFNQQNHVAAYSSEPISYDSILLDTENGSKVESYPNFSFLTFSPRGEYAALSNQGYVSKYDKHGNERLEWGHMPSCEVYVVHSSDFGNVLIKFSDLSKSGIDGLADKDHNCSKTVTSVSFSNDNKRLMMVGNDGVVVIRNLYFNNDAE